MSDMERGDRIVGALFDESTEPMRWWWLSFTDADLPEGSQFLGVAVVEARGLAWAITVAHGLGINPGGDVMAIEIPDEHVPPESFRNRLLDRAEAESL